MKAVLLAFIMLIADLGVIANDDISDMMPNELNVPPNTPEQAKKEQDLRRHKVLLNSPREKKYKSFEKITADTERYGEAQLPRLLQKMRVKNLNAQRKQIDSW